MFQAIALFIATAYYLWYVDTDTICVGHTSFYSAGQGVNVNVSLRFKRILKLWWAYAVTDFVRSVIALCAVAAQSKLAAKILAIFYQVLVANDLLLIAIIIILHIYRFQESGKYCSGDFMDNLVNTPGFLVDKGKYLLGLVIYVWVGLFTYVCLMGCILTAEHREKLQKFSYKQVDNKERK